MKLVLIAILLSSTCAIAQTSTITINKTTGATISLVADSGKAKIIRFFCGSVKTKTPLFILNGFVLADSLVTKIDPKLIKSIDALKDAAANQKFGPAAQNGVVVITVKQELIDDLTKKGLLKPVL